MQKLNAVLGFCMALVVLALWYIAGRIAFDILAAVTTALVSDLGYHVCTLWLYYKVLKLLKAI